jgi:V/A-type H+-transporting ATPase subunit I
MRFISLTGPKADIDRVANKYLSKYEIHLENALTELSSVQNLSPYIQTNPYKDLLAKATEFSSLVSSEKNPLKPEDVSLSDSIDLIEELDGQLTAENKVLASLQDQANKLDDSRRTIQPFVGMDYDVKSVLGFKHVDFRFGRIPVSYFAKFNTYIYDNIDTIFQQCKADEDYVWGVYFVPSTEAHKIDAVYDSMHFERIFIPDEYSGKPKDAYEGISREYDALEQKIVSVKADMKKILDKDAAHILGARNRLDSLSQNFDIRRMAAVTNADVDTFYILCGWMSENDVRSFQKDIENDNKVFCVVGEDQHDPNTIPPTKLKNPKLFKPYEMYIQMYGLPNYHEFDPTIFVAITYSFIFGAMFGDAGQGLCLLIGGLFLYLKKHMPLAGIIASAGVFSTFFGVMFGSFFGFEDVIPAVWLRPTDAMMTLPFIGKLNTVFVVAVAFGMFLIILTMIMHIINAFRQRDTEGKWFDTNALAGLIFYGTLVAVIVLYMSGHSITATGLILFLLIGSFIAMFFKEPLTNLVNKKKKLIGEGVGMFITQSFFEMFEVMLSYFSNTLSFVRIGAFAVSHAAMMQVVLMLAGATKGNINWIAIVIGNLFVMGLEGLIVGIQVLRLEYYELFSRFYKGDGKLFTSSLHNKKTV